MRVGRRRALERTAVMAVLFLFVEKSIEEMKVRKGWETRIISNNRVEAMATSDKPEGKVRKAVRSRSNFGQVWRKSTRSCPNMRLLRTRLEEKYGKLSEHEATSDKIRGKVREVVRT